MSLNKQQRTIVPNLSVIGQAAKIKAKKSSGGGGSIWPLPYVF